MVDSDKRSAIESNTEIEAKNMTDDSAIADASDMSTIQNPHLIEEESVEAVELHTNKNSETADIVPNAQKQSDVVLFSTRIPTTISGKRINQQFIMQFLKFFHLF